MIEARVTHRMALDHPDSVERIAVLDIVPSLDAGHFLIGDRPEEVVSEIRAFVPC